MHRQAPSAASGWTKPDAAEGAIGTSGQRLREDGLDMLGNPADAKPLITSYKAASVKSEVLRKVEKAAARSAFWGRGNGTSHVPGGIGPQAAQTLLTVGEDGIVVLASGFQVGAQAGGLPGIDDQGQIEQEGGGRSFLLLFFLLALFLACLRHLRSFLQTLPAWGVVRQLQPKEQKNTNSIVMPLTLFPLHCHKRNYS